MLSYFQNKYTSFKKQLQLEKSYKKEYRKSLNDESSNYVKLAALVSTVAWLGFAFDTDPKLHPEFTSLFFFRIGLSVLASSVFILSFLKQFQKYQIYLIYVIIFYALESCSYFTGRIADDANYVSGLQILLLLVVAIPVPISFSLSLFPISIILFILGVVLYHPDLSTDGAKYSMNNLVISYILGPMITYLLHRFRFKIFLQHHKVTQLKNQQDGDYFLTSTLIKPLTRNAAKKSEVEIEFFQSQYKKFSFRHWKSDLGGDLNSADTIELKEKVYTVFINSDAMGKSMQGAGGALILGSIFRSIINRTQNKFSERNQYPEHWLLSCFEEIQDAFIAFEGSMFVSAVIGLIDNTSGLLYYLNLEHPWVALFRDAKASFIEDEMQLRKFGTESNNQNFSIKTFQLEPGDILISGSDGRDDLLLGYDIEGRREINQDENLFLRNIEMAHADIDLLVSEIKATGDITDDLSLLRIEYKKEHITSSQSFSKDEEELLNNLKVDSNIQSIIDKALVDIGLAKRFYQKLTAAKLQDIALKFSIEYCRVNPSEISFLYLVSYLAKLEYAKTRKKDSLILAANFSERIYYRQRNNRRNLLNLANIYQLFGKKDKTQEILAELLDADPNNEKALKMKQALTN